MQGKSQQPASLLLLVQPTGICAAEQSMSKTKMLEPPSDKFDIGKSK